MKKQILTVGIRSGAAIRLVCLIVLISGFFFNLSILSLGLAAQGRDDYDALVHRARAGDTEPALGYLRQMGADASLQMRLDHILIASWAGKPEEVIATYKALPAQAAPLPAAPLPANVMQVVGRAFRDLRRYDEALLVLREGVVKYPQEGSAFAPLLIMALADAGKVVEAVKTGLDWVGRAPQDEDIRLALSYAYVAQKRPFDAYYQTQKAYQLAPNKPYVEDEYIRALQRIDMPSQALERAKKLPAGRFSPAQLRAMEADIAAIQTRIAATSSRSEAERFVVADRALENYDRLIKNWRGLGSEADRDVTRLRIDRLAALHARVRTADLVQEYEALRVEGVDVPVWALSNVASAYLSLRQPEKARDLYRVVLADLEARTSQKEKEGLGYKDARLSNEIGLFYALSEAEQFDEIPAVIKNIDGYVSPWLYLKGQVNPEPNANYLTAKLAVVAADMARDNTPAAQEKLEEMIERAPGNGDLHANLANVYRARSQPRRAESQLKLAETLEPRSLNIEAGQAHTALNLQEWRQAEELKNDLITRFPENASAQRLERAWQVHNMAELRVSSSVGLANDSQVSSSGDVRLDSVLYSKPLGFNWRLFAGVGHAQGTYREGHGYYNWLRAGVEWRSRDVWLEGEVSANHYAGQTKPGVRVSAAYDVNDYWQVGGSAEYMSRQTPVRALRSRINSDILQAYLRWRGSERREWQLNTSLTRFSDGNERLSLGLTGQERLYTAPHLKVDFLFDVGSQHSSKDDNRPYFNPKRDVMALPSLRATHILYRRYETVWEHYATLSAGAYGQKGYSHQEVLGFEYGQRYRHNDVFEVGASINGISRPYDGDRESEWRLLLDLTSRF